TIDVNLRGVASGIQAVYPRMVEQRFGHMVNTASIAGLVPFPLFTAYSATKHAVVALSTTLRVEARRFGVQVSALCPGAIRTPLLTGGAFGRPLGDVSDARMLEWWQRVFPIEVDVLACKALDAVARNRAIIVIPRWIKILWWFWRINPDLGRFLLQADFDQSLKKFPEFTKPPSKGR
ncbi:MAG: SDR family NAD(P)-dependent oxidoreductase, partial [Bdellovibrionota bacterium]